MVIHKSLLIGLLLSLYAHNVANHRRQKAERRRSAAFCCPSVCDC